MANEIEKDETYFVVYNWMITRLGLKDTALLVYALIYGYTKNVGKFSGSVSYIMARINKSKPPVQDALKKLVEQGLLKRNDVYVNGMKYVEYTAVGGGQESCLPREENLPRGGQESCLPREENLPRGGQESCHNNTTINKKENTIYIKEGASPGLQEILEYIWQKQSYVDPEKFYDYYESRGWKRKNGKPIGDWRKLVDEWDEREKRMQQAKPSPASTAGVGNAKLPKNAPTGESSFDVDDFFAAALRQSYEDLDGG